LAVHRIFPSLISKPKYPSSYIFLSLEVTAVSLNMGYQGNKGLGTDGKATAPSEGDIGIPDGKKKKRNYQTLLSQPTSSLYFLGTY